MHYSEILQNYCFELRRADYNGALGFLQDILKHECSPLDIGLTLIVLPPKVTKFKVAQENYSTLKLRVLLWS